MSEGIAASRLQWVLQTVSDWLRFPEAKNGALIIADGAALVGLLAAWPVTDEPMLQRWYFLPLGFLLALATVVSLVSFFPRTTIPRLLPEGPPDPDVSLVFFGHIRNFSPKYYLRAWAARAGNEFDPTDAWQLDLAGQIVANSRIAAWKFDCFRVAAWTTVAAVCSLPVAVVLWLALSRKGG